MARKSKTIPNHPWDRAAATPLVRQNYAFGGMEKVDPGVNFFVLALEALGAQTRFSCEGHPTGFYVLFEAPYDLALEIEAAGFFAVQIEDRNCWSIRKTNGEYIDAPYTEAKKAQTLRWAAEAWVRVFGTRLASLECLKAPGSTLTTMPDSTSV